MHVCVQSCPTFCNALDYSPPAPLSMSFFQARILEYIAISSPLDLPNPGIESMSLMSPSLSGRFFTTGAPREAPDCENFYFTAWINGHHLIYFIYILVKQINGSKDPRVMF